MKKLRKAIALFVVMIMAVSLMPQMVMAATDNEAYLYGWYRNNAASASDNVKSYIATSPTVTGGHSLYMQHNDTAQEWSAVSVDQDIVMTAGTYTLSLWVAGQYDQSKCAVILEGGEWQEHKLNSFTVGTEEINYFRQFTTTVTISEGTTNTRFKLVSNGGSAGFYVDDISLVKQGTTENIIKNGSFDEKDPAEAYLYGWYRNNAASASDNVKSYIATSPTVTGGHSLYMQHNDTAQEWSAVSVDQDIVMTAGTYTLSLWVAGQYDGSKCAVILEGGEWQEHKLNSCTVGTEEINYFRQFTKTVTIPEGTTNTRFKLVSNGGSAGFYVDDISLVKQGTTENIVENGSFEDDGTSIKYMYGWSTSGAAQTDTVKAKIATNSAAAGAHSLYVQNRDQSWNEFFIDQNITIPAGTYTLSFWLKGEYGANDRIILSGDHWQIHKFNNTELAEGTGTAYTTTPGQNGWTKYEKTVVMNAANNLFRIYTPCASNGFYIDDISLVKEGTTNNLILNGGFEFDGVATEAANAEERMSKWERFIPNGMSLNERSNSFVTSDVAYSGDNSYYIKHIDTTNGNWSLFGINQNIYLEAGNYTLSFWAFGEYNAGLLAAIINGPVWTAHDNIFSVVESNGHFKKYQGTISISQTGQYNVTLGSKHEAVNLYIDDISLVKQGTANELIFNGGFEHVHSYSVWQYADANNHQKACGCGLSVKEAHVWDSGDITKQPTVNTEGVKTYTCAICNGTKTEAVAKLAATEGEDSYMFGWYRSGIAQSAAAKTQIVTNNAVSGKNSLYIQNSNNAYSGAISVDQNVTIPAGKYTLSFWVAGSYNGGTATIILEGDQWQTHKFGNTEKYDYGTDFTHTTGQDGWTKFEKTLTITGTNTKIRIVSDGGESGFYIDDIRLVKEGTTDNILSNESFELEASANYTDEHSEFFANWSREDAFTPDGNLAFSCVTNKFAHTGDNSAVIRHTNSDKEWSAIAIKQDIAVSEGTYTLSFWAAGEYPVSNFNCVILDGGYWESHNLNTFTVTETQGIWKKYQKTVTVQSGKIQTVIKFASNGQTSSWYIDDISLVKEGTTDNLIKNGSFEATGYDILEPEIINLDGDTSVGLKNLEAGTLEVSVQIKNYSMGNNFAPIMIVALYDRNELIEMATVQQTIYESSTDGMTDELCITIDVPEETGSVDYRLKVMCWDSWDALKPLRDVSEIH